MDFYGFLLTFLLYLFLILVTFLVSWSVESALEYFVLLNPS